MERIDRRERCELGPDPIGPGLGRGAHEAGRFLTTYSELLTFMFIISAWKLILLHRKLLSST